MSGISPSALAPDGAVGDGRPRGRGRGLLLARAGWIVAAVVILGLDVLGTPATFRLLQVACTGSDCVVVHQPSPAQVSGLLASGVSLGFFATSQIALLWIGVLIYVTIAAVIFWKRPDDRMAMFGAYTLLIFGAGTVFGPLNALVGDDAAWALLASLTINAGPLMFYAFFCLFPSGHFVPAWIRWVALAWVLVSLVTLIPYPPLQSLLAGAPLPFVTFFGLLVFAQIYRYRKVSTPMQREQTKWVVLGFAAGMGGFLAVLGFSNLVVGQDPQSTALGIFLIATTLDVLLWLIPISIGIAILRSRLWDIDVLINRALVYGSLTVLLAALYWGLVAGAQVVIQALTGMRSLPQAAVVASTLIVAALFQPLRRRIQAQIDRRFFRRRYDAAKTLAGFGAMLRSETDLVRLTGQMVAVVEETMRPAHVSLWLAPERARREGAR